MTPGTLWAGLALIAAAETVIADRHLVALGWTAAMMVCLDRLMAAAGIPW